MKYIPIVLVGLVGSVRAETVQIKVSHDTWVGESESKTVNQKAASKALRVATPSNQGAYQYNRRALFGFDLSSVDLKSLSEVSFSATSSTGIDRSFDKGMTLRAYLVTNKISDKFSQMTATADSVVTSGFYTRGAVSDNRVNGISLGEYTTSGSASEQTIVFKFGADALANLKSDSNKFATIIIENRTGNNVGFGSAAGANTGLAFQSLETPGGKPAKLMVTMESTETSSALISFGGIKIGLDTEPYSRR